MHTTPRGEKKISNTRSGYRNSSIIDGDALDLSKYGQSAINLSKFQKRDNIIRYEESSSSTDNYATAQSRSEGSVIIKFCYNIVNKKKFSKFINAVIIINTFTLAQDRYKIDEDYVKLLEKINIALSGVFFLEMILMLIGIGFREYVQDSFNIFDAVIVLISVPDIAVQQFMSSDEQANS